MLNWSSLSLFCRKLSGRMPLQPRKFLHPWIGLWLTRDVRESSSVASSRHREHTQGIKGLRVPPDVLTFSLLFSAFFSFQWPVGGSGCGASFGGAPIVENGHGSQLEKVPPWRSGGGGRRLEAAMFMRWRPIDEAHKEGITIWSDVSISNTFSLGCSRPDSSTAK